VYLLLLLVRNAPGTPAAAVDGVTLIYITPAVASVPAAVAFLSATPRIVAAGSRFSFT
jgi:hypothetical protein